MLQSAPIRASRITCANAQTRVPEPMSSVSTRACGWTYAAGTWAQQSSLPGLRTDVVIPTWNAAEMLCRCLRALAAERAAVIVVDNASADGAARRVRSEFPDVVVVELPENAGFGRAVNAGVAAGDGDAIVLVNNDMLVEPGFV